MIFAIGEPGLRRERKREEGSREETRGATPAWLTNAAGEHTHIHIHKEGAREDGEGGGGYSTT